MLTKFIAEIEKDIDGRIDDWHRDPSHPNNDRDENPIVMQNLNLLAPRRYSKRDSNGIWI